MGTQVMQDKNSGASVGSQVAKLEALLNSAVDGIITIRKDGSIESVNPAAAKLFQYEVDEFLGQNVKFLMPDPWRHEHDAYLSNYLGTGQRKIIGIGRDVQGQRKDGSVFPMHLSVSEFNVNDEVFFTGIIHDLSERRAAEQALQQAQKMEAIGQLTGGVAHDFNNLLTVITGNLELMEMRLEDKNLRDLLGEAQEAADMGARLTERLLAFARRSQLEPKVVDLNELAIGLTDLLQRTLGSTISLSSTLGSGLWPVIVDPAQLESAIVNLAVNARDAMPDGGKLVLETRNVVIEDTELADEIGIDPGDYVLLSVTDTGHGMKEDVVQRALEPFFTTKEVGRGTGLGLSMVYGFTKQSRGNLTIYSEVGVGSTVNLYLPRGATAHRQQSNETSVAELPAGSGELILVVEDDDRVRRLTVSRLKQLGYEVVEAENGPRALELLAVHPNIQLVFTDLVMPGGMSGYDVCEQVRKNWPGKLVLLTSGYAEELTHGDKLASENLTLLRKPYRQSALAQAIAQMFENK